MARKAIWPPVRRPHKGQERVRHRGHDYYLAGKPGSPEADAAYAALLAQLAEEEEARKRPPDPFARLTVADAARLWMAEVLGTLDARAQKNYKRSLTVLVREAGEMRAAEFEAGDLDRVRASMRSGKWMLAGEAGRHGLTQRAGERLPGPLSGRKQQRKNQKAAGPWCASYCNRQVGRIKTVWRWLDLRKHVPKGSWGGLRTLKALPVPRPKRRDWRTADVVKVAVAMSRSTARYMLLVQLWTGCRSGEVRGMLWSEIDRSGPVWAWCPARHKNAWRGHERRIALGPRAQSVLKLQRKREPRGDLVFPCRPRARGPVTGEFTPSAYGKTVAGAAARVGLAGLHPYAARHAARMRFSRAGGLEMARSAMGHAGADMTASYGQAQDMQLAMEAARRAG